MMKETLAQYLINIKLMEFITSLLSCSTFILPYLPRWPHGTKIIPMMSVKHILHVNVLFSWFMSMSFPKSKYEKQEISNHLIWWQNNLR